MTASHSLMEARGREAEMKCPTCDSPSPNRHPSVQFEGETEPCIDHFHDADDRQSDELKSYIAAKREKLNEALAGAIAAKRAEIDRLGLCSWPLRTPRWWWRYVPEWWPW